MKEGWRWFGPFDRIGLAEVAQTGARDIVTALHEVPAGEVWTSEAIADRQALVDADAALGLRWSVVESLTVHDAIKRGDGKLDPWFAAYRQSLANLAAAGIRVVCYNFMPVLDWLRTDLAVPVRGGARALRFSEPKMAAFELCMLGRETAEADYAAEACAAGRDWFAKSSEAERDALLAAIMAGLPGAHTRYDIAGMQETLAGWAGVTDADLRASYSRFLSEVVPAAEELGIRLCVHPDDPPRPVFGLPRIVSTEADAAWVLAAADSPANGLTFCAGAFGSHPQNDLIRMFRRFGDRVHFLHLRNVTKEPDRSFEEDAHLDGDTDMAGLVAAILDEEARRQGAGREDWELPFRPDHGHEIAGDIGRDAHPGYPLIGRLRGLAELRGVIAGIRGLREAQGGPSGGPRGETNEEEQRTNGDSIST